MLSWTNPGIALARDPLFPSLAGLAPGPGGNQVDFVTGTDSFGQPATLLVALFAKDGQSRLRAYDLTNARNVAGTEIAPKVDLRLSEHPARIGDMPSFPTGIAVDGTTVYVAMGAHGIARYTFPAGQLDPLPPGGSPATAQPSWGPIFDDPAGPASLFSMMSPPDEEAELGFAGDSILAPIVADVATIGGGLEIYRWSEMTDPSGAQPVFEEWVGRDSVADELPNNTWNVAIDPISDDPAHARIYAAVPRVGIQVFDFIPTASGDRLDPIELIQTPGEVQWVELREDPGTGGRSLVVTDVGGGIRILED